MYTISNSVYHTYGLNQIQHFIDSLLKVSEAISAWLGTYANRQSYDMVCSDFGFSSIADHMYDKNASISYLLIHQLQCSVTFSHHS
jgi:hypothetical protein